MRRIRYLVAASALAVGCNTLAVFLPGPEPATVVPGGMTNLSPYYGTLKSAIGLDAGDFMLASCGCGDWRVLIEPTDGTARKQFTVHFYTDGAYTDTGEVRVYGADEDSLVVGMIAQGSGTANGAARRTASLYSFVAQRGEAHTDDAEACVRCHIGEDPIWPQPPSHPAYQLNPANCLDCHEVVIDE